MPDNRIIHWIAEAESIVLRLGGLTLVALLLAQVVVKHLRDLRDAILEFRRAPPHR